MRPELIRALQRFLTVPMGIVSIAAFSNFSCCWDGGGGGGGIVVRFKLIIIDMNL